jgi:hypothetical protein
VEWNAVLEGASTRSHHWEMANVREGRMNEAVDFAWLVAEAIRKKMPPVPSHPGVCQTTYQL